MSNNVMLNERVLPDNYPVYGGYFYVCDGEVITSDVFGKVSDLKKDLRSHYKLEAKEITNCDIVGRGMNGSGNDWN